MTIRLALRLAPALMVLALAAPVAAVDTGTPVPQLSEARADIDAEAWDSAIAKLKLIVDADNTNADAYNLLGFALRHTGANERAMGFSSFWRSLRSAPARGARPTSGPNAMSARSGRPSMATIVRIPA